MTLYRLIDEKQGDDWIPIGTVSWEGERLLCFLARSCVFHDIAPRILDNLTPEDLPLGPGAFRLGPMSAVDLPFPEDGSVDPERMAPAYQALLERVRSNQRQRVPVRRCGEEAVVGFVEVSARGELTCEGPADLEAGVAESEDGVWILRDVFERSGSQAAVPVILTPDQFMFVEWLFGHFLQYLGYEPACPMPWLGR